MRTDVQNIFKATPHQKQVMMFSATLSKEVRPICKRFMHEVWVNLIQPMEVYIDDETKLTLHGLRQHYLNVLEKDKNRKLLDILDSLEFNQVILISYRLLYS